MCYHRGDSADGPVCRLGLPLKCSRCRAFRIATRSIVPAAAPSPAPSPELPEVGVTKTAPTEYGSQSVVRAVEVSGGCGCKKGR